MELVYLGLKAGDALFIHSNLLHRSEPIYPMLPHGQYYMLFIIKKKLPVKQMITS